MGIPIVVRLGRYGVNWEWGGYVRITVRIEAIGGCDFNKVNLSLLVIPVSYNLSGICVLEAEYCDSGCVVNGGEKWDDKEEEQGENGAQGCINKGEKISQSRYRWRSCGGEVDAAG